jgi:hypothetical protein
MLIKMKRTTWYTEDGHSGRDYLEGEIYEPRDHVAKNAIKDGVAYHCDSYGNKLGQPRMEDIKWLS